MCKVIAIQIYIEYTIIMSRLNKCIQRRRIGRVIENDKFSIGVKSCHSEQCTQKLGRKAVLSLIFPLFFRPFRHFMALERAYRKTKVKQTLLQPWQKRSSGETSRQSLIIFDLQVTGTIENLVSRHLVDQAGRMSKQISLWILKSLTNSYSLCILSTTEKKNF